MDFWGTNAGKTNRGSTHPSCLSGLAPGDASHFKSFKTCSAAAKTKSLMQERLKNTTAGQPGREGERLL